MDVEEATPRAPRLYDDEEFTFADALARPLLYLPLDPHRPLFGGDTGRAPPENLVVLNLTGAHFRAEGATKFADLSDETSALLNLIFDALSFAHDRKQRHLRRPPAPQVRGRAALRASAAVPAEGGDAAPVEEQAPTEFMNGAEHLSVYLETLLGTPGDQGEYPVAGYRLWVFDASHDGAGVDLVTKAIKEALRDAGEIQQSIEAQLAVHQRSAGTARRGQPPKQYDVAAKYKFARTHDEPLLFSAVGGYFARDDCLLLDPSGLVAEPPSAAEERAPFVDRRAFLPHNRGQTVLKLGADGETMATMFTVTQAMHYYVEGVCPEQCSLASYFAVEDEEAATDPLRLMKLAARAPDDSAFQRFPFPSVTYRIASAYAGHDVLADAPLPHRLGSCLSSTRHAAELATKLSTTRRPADLSHEDRELELAGRARPLGLHEVEQEVTAEALQQYAAQLTPDMRRQLGARRALSATSRLTFLTAVRRAIADALHKLAGQSRNSRKQYLVERVVATTSTSRLRARANPVVETRDELLLFAATTRAGPVNNRNKEAAIERRVLIERGGEGEALARLRDTLLAKGALASYREVIAQWRPVEATVENVKAKCGQLVYDEVYMRRDIYLILDSLNTYGFAQIDAAFFDPVTGQVRRGKLSAYRRARREFIEAITVEFMEHFFTSKAVSRANEGIREDLDVNKGKEGARRLIGLRIPVARFGIQVRPYHYYKLWLYSYFADHCAISHHYKTMNVLFHAKYHHCRYYRPGARDPKMNVMLSGMGMGGKSHRLIAVKETCPTNVAEGITHWTAQSFNVDQNMNDMLMICEEMSNKLLMPAGGGAGGGGTSEAANDDARNNFKERATAGESSTLYFYYDEETGERRVRLAKCQCQNVTLGATNNDLTHMDPNVASRFIIISVPRGKQETIGMRPQDKDKYEMGKDAQKSQALVEQMREVHRIYFMVEMMIKSGVLGDSVFGVTIDSARLLIANVLDTLHARYGIATNDVRKRKHVLEMARSMCISYAVWYGLTSPLTRSLQYDVANGEFIGFNARVLLDGIVPQLVITKDHVIDALTSLTCLWSHEYEERILEDIAKKCLLHEPEHARFLKRPPGQDDSATALEANEPRAGDAGRPQRYRGGGDADMYGTPDQELVTDYNYVVVGAKSYTDLLNVLSLSMGEHAVAPNDINKLLRDFSRSLMTCDGYALEKRGETTRLVRTPGQNKPRKLVDFGRDALTKQPTIALNVAFLKQKLPHLLTDDLIEDLMQLAPRAEPVDQVGEGEGGEEEEEAMEMEVEGRERALENEGKLEEQVRRALTIERGAANETCMIKAIREVLENAELERGADNAEQEAADAEAYSDAATGKLPWLSYVTAEHPPALLMDRLFPQLYPAFQSKPGANKELLLVDKLATIEMERRRDGIPLVQFNYNTVAPSTRTTLSVYDTRAVDEYDARPDDEETAEALRVARAERDEEARIEAERLSQAMTKRRYTLYSNEPTVLIDADIDYLSCVEHAERVGVLRPRDSAGRLLNYPPHVYMSLVDDRDRQRAAGVALPAMQGVHADVFDRIEKMGRIMEARLGRARAGTLRMSQLQSANYHEADVAAESLVDELARRTTASGSARRLHFRQVEEEERLAIMRERMERHPMGAGGSIVTTVSSVTRGPKRARH